MDGSGGARENTTPILIVGCGFGALGLAIALKKAGMTDFTILERAADAGGVWRDNIYPGAACDVVSRFYSFSTDQDFEWSHPFAPQAEILTYYRKCFDRYQLRPHVRFNSEVRRAVFDAATATWRITTATGEVWRTPVFVSAVGLFNQPIVPEIPGRSGFRGRQFHSAAWDHAYRLDGKRVAVIGNGASAIQFVPHVARQAAQLTLFQRSPQYVFPKSLFPGVSKFDYWLNSKPWLRWLARLKIYAEFERFIVRRRFFPEMRLKGEAAFRQLLEQKISDPVLRQKLTPRIPMGCKRQIVSDEWYEALVRPNVKVVDTKIARILPDGIETADGEVSGFDAIIYGTGFKPTEYLTPMRISGLQGRDLNDAWRDGAEAYLGITVPDFPNFFMVYGPNTNMIGSIIFVIECQARYIVQCIKALRRRGGYMSVRRDRHDGFVAEMARRLAITVAAMPVCHNYSKLESGRITTNWPGFNTEYLLRTYFARMSDFEFVAPAVVQDVPKALAAE